MVLESLRSRTQTWWPRASLRCEQQYPVAALYTRS